MQKGNIFIRATLLFVMIGILWMSYLFRQVPDPIPGLGPRIVTFQEEKVSRWELSFKTTKIVCQKETNGSFSLLQPAPLRTIDSSEFLANVKNLNTLEYLHIAQKNAQDPSYWGVDGSRTYRLFFQNPQKVLEFQIGSFSKSFQGFYLQYNSDIYCVPKWVVEAIEKRPQELRRGYFLNKDINRIFSLWISLQNNKTTFVQKDGFYWKVNGISKDSLHIPNVDGLVQDVSFAKSELVFCASDPEFSTLSKELLALKTQSLFVIVTCSDGTTINFSLFRKDNRLYGIREDKKDIEILPMSLYESLTKPVDFYLKK